MLGFKCPPLVNPPDFFLDLISGEVERQGHPEFAPQHLFDLWEENRHMYPELKIILLLLFFESPKV